MQSITLDLPDRTYEHLKSVALVENKSFEHFATEILILAERELSKTCGHYTENQLTGMKHFNKHCR